MFLTLDFGAPLLLELSLLAQLPLLLTPSLRLPVAGLFSERNGQNRRIVRPFPGPERFWENPAIIPPLPRSCPNSTPNTGRANETKGPCEWID